MYIFTNLVILEAALKADSARNDIEVRKVLPHSSPPAVFRRLTVGKCGGLNTFKLGRQTMFRDCKGISQPTFRTFAERFRDLIKELKIFILKGLYPFRNQSDRLPQILVLSSLGRQTKQLTSANQPQKDFEGQLCSLSHLNHQLAQTDGYDCQNWERRQKARLGQMLTLPGFKNYRWLDIYLRNVGSQGKPSKKQAA